MFKEFVDDVTFASEAESLTAPGMERAELPMRDGTRPLVESTT